jgi:2'-5' RNA ligase
MKQIKIMARCFIGVMLPEYLKDDIVKIQQAIKSLPIDCKMVERRNMHICLSFLGEVEDGNIGVLKENLDKLCSKHSSMDAHISGIKFIPNEKYVRVIVMDCSSQELNSLGENIQKEIGGDAKPPHITLCRVKNIADKHQTIKKIKELESDVGRFRISSIQIIKSQLQESGPVYSILHETKLG